MESVKKLNEMVTKLCSVVDQEAVFVPAGFLRELEKEMACALGQSDASRMAAMSSLHKASHDANETERKLEVCRRELGRSREELVDLRDRHEAMVASLEEDLRAAILERDAALKRIDEAVATAVAMDAEEAETR